MGFWDWYRGIDSELRKVLDEVEGKEPIKVGWGSGLILPDLSTASVAWQESVLTDPEWYGIRVEFVRETEDGEIHTSINLDYERASGGMSLNGVVLARFNYTKSGCNDDSQKRNPAAVSYVRQWMRRRILPAIVAAKTLRESESRRLLAEREAMRQKYRRKYLP